MSSRSRRFDSAQQDQTGTDDLYEILEVPRNASTEEIRRQYKRLALRWHPDKNPENREYAEQMFKKISRAYEVLSNDQTRRVYDTYGLEGLEGGGAPPPSAYAGPPRGTARGGSADPFYGFGGGGFDDFFGNDFGFPGMGVGFGGAGGRPQRGGFMFHDPFDIFRQVFGDNDPFMSFAGFEQPHRHGSHHRGQYDPFGMFGGPMMPDMMGGNGSTFSYSSSSSTFGGPGAASRSVSSTTQIVNGQKVTRTVTRVQQPDGTVTEDVDEKVENLGNRIADSGNSRAPPGSRRLR